MENDMLFLKRYGAPFVLAIALYSLVYLIFGHGSEYLSAGIAFSILASYLIRLCDDIGDYEEDLKNGKAPISKKALTVLCLSVTGLFIALAFIFSKHLMLLAPLPILLQIPIKDRYRVFLKPLFVPVIVITIVFSFFSSNYLLYVILPVLIIFDVFLIICKQHRRSL